MKGFQEVGVSRLRSHADPFSDSVRNRHCSYRFRLTGRIAEPVSTYIVEFLSAENLVIPFPAAMINHRGLGFLNSVHAFNRVLNDVFEDDGINARREPEASVAPSLRERPASR